jgi:hypothetical protein
MTARLKALIAGARAAAQGDRTHVHFHQGPQGLPAPCFDESCPNPRLST